MVALSSLIREKVCTSLRLLIVVIFDQAPPEKKKRFLFNHEANCYWNKTCCPIKIGMKPGQTQLKDGNTKVAHLHNNKQKEHFFVFALVLFFAHFAVVFILSTPPGNDLFCRSMQLLHEYVKFLLTSACATCILSVGLWPATVLKVSLIRMLKLISSTHALCVRPTFKGTELF